MIGGRRSPSSVSVVFSSFAALAAASAFCTAPPRYIDVGPARAAFSPLPVVAPPLPSSPRARSFSPPLGRATTLSAEPDDEDESWLDVLDEIDDDGNQDVVLYTDEEEEQPSEQRQSVPWKKNARWNSLKPEIKMKIIEEGRRKATEKKRRREPVADKKRRLLTRYEESQRRKKLQLRVKRPTSLKSPARVPLSSLSPGTELNGTVISLTSFGAYVDVGTEVDGLLHVSQLTREIFVEHPRQFLSPGEEVQVRVVRSSPELKKLQLTMLPLDETADLNLDDEEDDDESDQIPLEEIEVDDELWGEIVRVTSYGSYVELGAEVQGFLHFMDHPSFNVIPGSTPGEFMKIGDRVRVWALDVDLDRRRVKLTGNRPAGLPGPRWERGRRTTDRDEA